MTPAPRRSPLTAVRLSLRIYRGLLRGYPPSFRQEYGDVMEATFREAVLSAHARSGTAGLAALWLRITKDLVLSATRERIDARRRKASHNVVAPGAGGPSASRQFGQLLHDARYALRSLLRAPAFTAVSALTLGIGIAAAVTIFGVIEGVLLRPLPYAEPDNIVRIYGSSTDASGDLGNVSPVDAMDWREQSRTLEDIAVTNGSFFAMTGQGDPEMVWVTAASAALFDALEVEAAFGRRFTAEDETIGRHRVAMLAHGFWQSRFGGDPSVVSRTVELQGNPYEIVGVMPASFMDPTPGPFGDAALWRPFAFEYSPAARGGHWLQAYARLAPGATLASAQQEMRGIMLRLEQEYPATNTGQARR
ncbi:MAG TPA: ABC transporter permease [Longimicrobiales bacterium]|nr:ABC transporter permease [Longimicrobiales bacterium]